MGGDWLEGRQGYFGLRLPGLLENFFRIICVMGSIRMPTEPWDQSPTVVDDVACEYFRLKCRAYRWTSDSFGHAHSAS